MRAREITTTGWKRCATAFLIGILIGPPLAMATAGVSPGRLYRVIMGEPAGIGGYLTAIGFHPTVARGCEAPDARIAALAHTRDAKDVLAWLGARAAYAADPCQVIAIRPRVHNLIVNAGETALRDCFNANAGSACTATVAVWKYHGAGSSSTAAAETDTGCTSEFTTETNPDSTRATGSQTTNGTNVYRTVATVTFDATATAREWCLHQAASGASTMWSRVVYSDIGVSASDTIQFTYDVTFE